MGKYKTTRKHNMLLDYSVNDDSSLPLRALFDCQQEFS